MSDEKPKRTSNTCVQCRLRKVRCDGKRGKCSNCERLGFECSFHESTRNENQEARKPERKRARQACANCHSLKIRCSGEMPACRRCEERGINCHYLPSRRSTKRINLAHSSDGNSPNDQDVTGSNDGNQNPNLTNVFADPLNIQSPSGSSQELAMTIDRSTVLNALDNFFKYIHPLPAYSFLHKSSLLQRYNIGRAEPTLILSIIGITSQMLDNTNEFREFGCRCVDQAESSILQDLEHPSISKLQALLLIMRHRTSLRRFSSAFILMASASRIAFALRLNFENPKLCFLAQEARRRLMWSIFILDTTWAAGLPEFTLCPVSVVNLQLPCGEEDFELDRECTTEPLKPTSSLADAPSLSLLAYYIRIMDYRDSILRYTKRVASTGEILDDIPEKVRAFESELREFQERLPPNMKFSEKNLRLRAYSPVLPRYLMIHIWWQQCHCDLYRFLVKGFRESLSRQRLLGMDPEFINYCQIQCFEHANSISNIFSMFLGLEIELPVLDNDIGVCAYQSARILFHAFQTNAARFGLTSELVWEKVLYCWTLLEKLSRSSYMLRSIKEDIEKLLARGSSSPSSTSRANSPEVQSLDQRSPTSAASNARQILSRHSLIKGTTFQLDTSELDMPTTAIPAPQPPPDESGQLYAVPTPSQVVFSGPSISTPTVDLQDSPGDILTHGTRPSDINPQQQDTWQWNNAYQEMYDLPIHIDPVSRIQTEWSTFDFLQDDPWPGDTNTPG